jgi:hypothetical protein
MRNLLILLMAFLLPLSVGCAHKKSDAAIRSAIVRISGGQGMCSGSQIIGPSGEQYILSAGHCAHMAVDGSVDVKDENGNMIKRRVVAESPVYDLLLIEGLPGTPRLEIADSMTPKEVLRVFSHGRDMPTYETSGIAITTLTIQMPAFPIGSMEDLTKCTSMAKFKAEGPMCLLEEEGVVTTALIVPGSSGAPVLNSAGQVVGVASASNQVFGFVVPTAHVREFLMGY